MPEFKTRMKSGNLWGLSNTSLKRVPRRALFWAVRPERPPREGKPWPNHKAIAKDRPTQPYTSRFPNQSLVVGIDKTDLEH